MFRNKQVKNSVSPSSLYNTSWWYSKSFSLPTISFFLFNKVRHSQQRYLALIIHRPSNKADPLHLINVLTQTFVCTHTYICIIRSQKPPHSRWSPLLAAVIITHLNNQRPKIGPYSPLKSDTTEVISDKENKEPGVSPRAQALCAPRSVGNSGTRVHTMM